MENRDPLAELMRTSLAPVPSEDFTRRVMRKIHLWEEAGASSVLGNFFPGLISKKNWQPALCLFVAGFFYSLLGVIFYFGVNGVIGPWDRGAIPWVSRWIPVILASWLIVLGIASMRVPFHYFSAIRSGILIFILMAVFYGMFLLKLAAVLPMYLLSAVMTFSGGFMGILLYATFRHYERVVRDERS